MTLIPGRSAEKIVVNTNAGLIKGFLENPWSDVRDLLQRSQQRIPDVLAVRLDTPGDAVRKVPLSDVKAVFFVQSFEGNGHRKDLKFYSRAPIVHGIWVQVEFLDGEIVEGIVHNSFRHLVDSGFFLMPTDPSSNNKLVYVNKAALKDYRVLGVRTIAEDAAE